MDICGHFFDPSVRYRANQSAIDLMIVREACKPDFTVTFPQLNDPIWVRNGSTNTVIRCFFSDGHIVHMAFAHAGIGDSYEIGFGSQGVDIGTTGITHSRT